MNVHTNILLFQSQMSVNKLDKRLLTFKLSQYYIFSKLEGWSLRFPNHIGLCTFVNPLLI